MIVPMVKYGFLVYHRDFELFLSKLQELGVVDIIKQTHNPNEKERGMLGMVGRYTLAINFLTSRKIEGEYSQDVNTEEIMKAVESNQKDFEHLEANIRKAQKELIDVAPWGDFNPDTIKAIESQGVTMRFIVASAKVFSSEWASEHPVEIIQQQMGTVYFVLLQKGDDIDVPFEHQEVKLPSFSFSQKQHEIDDQRKKLNVNSPSSEIRRHQNSSLA